MSERKQYYVIDKVELARLPEYLNVQLNGIMRQIGEQRLKRGEESVRRYRVDELPVRVEKKGRLAVVGVEGVSK